MRVAVRLFAIQRQQLGLGRLELELPDGRTAREAWDELARRHPVLEPAGPIVRFAVNGEYAAPGRTLAEGDELAVIPPVAGGRGSESRDDGVLAFTEDAIDGAVLARLEGSLPTDEDGAVVIFVGRVRSTPGTPAPGQEEQAARFEGRRVVALEYEAFESMAERILEAIALEAAERFGPVRLRVVHRVGRLEVGETSVAIAAAAPHRAAAFDACRYAIDELKARAPIWKSEHFGDGSVWLGEPPRTGVAEAGGRATGASLRE